MEIEGFEITDGHLLLRCALLVELNRDRVPVPVGHHGDLKPAEVTNEYMGGIPRLDVFLDDAGARHGAAQVAVQTNVRSPGGRIGSLVDSVQKLVDTRAAMLIAPC